MPANELKALVFDVFGTVVDWRSGVIAACRGLCADRGIERDWAAFADAWRGLYQPSMSAVREDRRPFVTLDRLHRESLDQLLREFAIEGLSEAEIDHLNRAWHRLDPWPDSVAGLSRLRRRYVLATLSNGNVALIVNMAKRVGLPWDAVLGAEVARQYKPLPEVYRSGVEMLGIAARECLMVAAHNSDLVAAAACGLRTAFIPRPNEHGPDQQSDLAPEGDYDWVASDLLDLAQQLGC